MEKLELQEIANKYKGYFIVNYENFEVIYTEGYENENGMWCYRISDLKKHPEAPKATNEQLQDEQTEQSEEKTENNAESNE